VLGPKKKAAGAARITHGWENNVELYRPRRGAESFSARANSTAWLFRGVILKQNHDGPLTPFGPALLMQLRPGGRIVIMDGQGGRQGGSANTKNAFAPAPFGI